MVLSCSVCVVWHFLVAVGTKNSHYWTPLSLGSRQILFFFLEICTCILCFHYNFKERVHLKVLFDMSGVSVIALKGGSWDSSPVEQAIPLMTAGVVTPIGTATGSALRNVALGLVGMLLVDVMVVSMS